MKYYNSTKAAAVPISVEELKTHLGIDSTFTTHDEYIESMLYAAVSMVENYTGRQLMAATWKLYLDSLPVKIELTKLPVQSITSIEYYDTDNSLQTLAANQYKYNLNVMPATIERADNVDSWPDTYSRTDAVIITFVAGYTNALHVPEDIKHAIKVIVRDMYDYRGDSQRKPSIKTSEYLLNPYVIPVV